MKWPITQKIMNIIDFINQDYSPHIRLYNTSISKHMTNNYQRNNHTNNPIPNMNKYDYNYNPNVNKNSIKYYSNNNFNNNAQKNYNNYKNSSNSN